LEKGAFFIDQNKPYRMYTVHTHNPTTIHIYQKLSQSSPKQVSLSQPISLLLTPKQVSILIIFENFSFNFLIFLTMNKITIKIAPFFLTLWFLFAACGNSSEQLYVIDPKYLPTPSLSPELEETMKRVSQTLPTKIVEASFTKDEILSLISGTSGGAMLSCPDCEFVGVVFTIRDAANINGLKVPETILGYRLYLNKLGKLEFRSFIPLQGFRIENGLVVPTGSVGVIETTIPTEATPQKLVNDFGNDAEMFGFVFFYKQDLEKLANFSKKNDSSEGVWLVRIIQEVPDFCDKSKIRIYQNLMAYTSPRLVTTIEKTEFTGKPCPPFWDENCVPPENRNLYNNTITLSSGKTINTKVLLDAFNEQVKPTLQKTIVKPPIDLGKYVKIPIK
jgi:hypothetical protein